MNKAIQELMRHRADLDQKWEKLCSNESNILNDLKSGVEKINKMRPGFNLKQLAAFVQVTRTLGITPGEASAIAMALNLMIAETVARNAMKSEVT